MFYDTYIPRRFVLDDGEEVVLKAIDVENIPKMDPMFKLYVPWDAVDKVYNHLINLGFEQAYPTIPKGEKYNIRIKLYSPWELHLRIYSDGFIEAEVEVQREYIQHLGDKRIYVVYEAFEYYQEVYQYLHIYYVPKQRWVVKVIDNFRVVLSPPDTLVEWKPIVKGIVLAGLLYYILSKLKEGSKR